MPLLHTIRTPAMASRCCAMSNVVKFPGHQVPQIQSAPDYVVIVQRTPVGFDWSIDNGSDNPNTLDMQMVANDLASISLDIYPPPRTFLERLRALIFGDDQ